MKLEDLAPGLRISGVVPHEVVQVIFAQPHGANAIEVTYKTSGGDLDQRIVFRRDEETLTVSTSGSRPFDAPVLDFKTAAEAQRIKLAGLYDPMLAVATSAVQPLPHQIRAVYGELLPRTPLRFLLADDPGAGKTIMAGLLIKELILRDDVQRCLVVAPGGLVEQWQDELFFKFGLSFEILTNQMIDAGVHGNVFDRHGLLIARMDQLARNEELQALLAESQWDLAIVDEAHRMGAHYFGNRVEKTKRFQLGELVGEVSRHLLLMTATPHSGKEEDFQLFLSLLDKDRFAGRRSKTVDTSDVMRRMIKEDLLTFDGRRLFPERIAESVPYQLSPMEHELYEAVTDYVRNGMNRAQALDGKRRNSVGFALTVLQRRLASSPEAIYKSLVRRTDRLLASKKAVENGEFPPEFFGLDVAEIDQDTYLASEVEELEERLVDNATAARTISELEAEILELTAVTETARRVREIGTDRKWSELKQILQDNIIPPDSAGRPRKLIIFTEHRDTLNYLSERMGSLLGSKDSVVSIHGSVRRNDRRSITEEFMKNPTCQIMLATDAAGEGLNLQAAHLMVNYDLPWNPNRIEQRFGRIHRIGQTEVCRLWNLVASDTREGEVFVTLLAKIEEQRRAYGGKVFDVLGATFVDTPLRDLLIEAIRYGGQPEVRARMLEVIDSGVADGIKELLEERALASENLSARDLGELRTAMDDARANRLQPYYVELAFKEAFTRFGGRIARREKGRYEIAQVPASTQNLPYSPIASRYERVTFGLEFVQPEGADRADLVVPGHPLHDAVMEQTVTTLTGVLNRGAVLVSRTLEEPTLLVGVVEEVVDATGVSVARRFGYAYVAEDGTVSDAGPAPYLDCIGLPDGSATKAVKALPWLANAEPGAVSWIIENRLPHYLAEVEPPRAAELAKQRALVESRLHDESRRLLNDAAAAAAMERGVNKPRESSEGLERKAADLQARLVRRLELLDQQRQMSTKPPLVVTSAVVVPYDWAAAELPADTALPAPPPAQDLRRAVTAVMGAEFAVGRAPVAEAVGYPGWDIRSSADTGETYRLSVKITEVDGTFWATRNEVMTAKNAGDRYRLALVRLSDSGDGPDEVRYLADPYARVDIATFEAVGHRGDWGRYWSRGVAPF